MTRHRSFFLPSGIAALLVVSAAGAALSGALGGTAQAATAPAAAPAAAATTAGCGKTPTLTSGSRTIQSGGQSRSYILNIPSNYNNTHPYRLIFGLHWLNGTMNNVASDKFYGLQPLSNNGTIFVAPQGIGNGWANTGGRDVTLVDDLTKAVENDLCVDTSQLFALGWSYGGAMSYAIACARPTVFRAVTAFSGANLSGCQGGTQPIGYFGIHGIHDSVLNISNGRTLRDTFVKANGCTAQSPPEPTRGSLTHTITAYSGCKAGYPVQWAAFDGDHTPNPVDGSTATNWSQSWTPAEVWKFFNLFPSTISPTPTPAAS